MAEGGKPSTSTIKKTGLLSDKTPNIIAKPLATLQQTPQNKKENEIRTDVDRVVELVGSSVKNKMSLRKISKELKLPYDIIEKWGRILDESNVLELVYPKNPLIGAYLRVRKTEYANKIDSNGLIKKKVEGNGETQKEVKLEKGSARAQETRGSKTAGERFGGGEKTANLPFGKRKTPGITQERGIKGTRKQ